MSLEAWGDGGDDPGGVTDERCQEVADENFRRGAQAMREMAARFVEQGGSPIAAQSIRANWNPNWGADPGPPTAEEYEQLRAGLDAWAWAP